MLNSSLFAESSLELNRHIVNLLDSLSALYTLTGIPLGDLDETQLLKQSLEALMSNQDMERCSIFLLDEHNQLTNAVGLDWHDTLRNMVGSADTLPAEEREKKKFNLGEGILGRVAATGVIEHCRSCADDPQFKQFSSTENPVQGALICVPIVGEEQVLGVLNVSYPVPGFFTLWHERLLLLFCKMLGRLLLSHRLMHQLSSMVEQKTQELSGANAMLMDEVAQRQETQHELAYQHRFLQSIMDGILEPIRVIGKDYRILLQNRSAETEGAKHGKHGETLCYQSSHHRDRPCAGEKMQCPLAAVLQQNRPITVVHEHFNAQGLLRYVELLASPLQDKNGAVVGIIESERDITERVQAEQATQQLNETLESRVKTEVAKNLENERLLIQQARLAAMGEMVGNIAHQWRQPINALGLLLGNLKDAYDYGDLNKEYLNQSVNNGQQMIQKMSTTIDDFRNFFKPTKEKYNFGLRAAIGDTLNIVGPSFENHNIALIVEEGEEVAVNGYPNEFSQVLLNVLNNAKDAITDAKRAGGSIKIRVGHDDEKGWVSVQDDGEGIPAASATKIFDPYFTTKEEGTGIGLYMSKMIMKHMGGNIVAGNTSEGAEFVLSLPGGCSP
ncbi:MAG: GAF domain-containing protein [Sulfuricellaceae bacterium]|nr:GAF domain-containing protein [Sulfuricellaceae bacterium]